MSSAKKEVQNPEVTSATTHKIRNRSGYKRQLAVIWTSEPVHLLVFLYVGMENLFQVTKY